MRIPLVLALLALAACDSGSDTPSTPSSLGIEDLVVGTGATALTGDVLSVHYVGRFTNGTQFDSSYDGNEPFTFRLGAGQVIPGWDQGIQGMREGGRRRLTVPPSLGYGSQPYGRIPANSTLVFDVELLDILNK